MNAYIALITAGMLLTGIFFLMVGGTDIQFGFGLVLLFMGLNNIPKALEKKTLAS